MAFCYMLYTRKKRGVNVKIYRPATSVGRALSGLLAPAPHDHIPHNSPSPQKPCDPLGSALPPTYRFWYLTSCVMEITRQHVLEILFRSSGLLSHVHLNDFVQWSTCNNEVVAMKTFLMEKNPCPVNWEISWHHKWWDTFGVSVCRPLLRTKTNEYCKEAEFLLL